MNELQIIEKFKLLSINEGEIHDLMDMDIPLLQKIDPIGYYNKRIDKEIELIKERKRDLNNKQNHLKVIKEDLRSILIHHLKEKDGNMVKGLESKAWLNKRSQKIPIESELKKENYKYTLTLKGLSWEEYQIINNGLEAIKIKPKIEKEVDISTLNKDQYVKTKSISVSISSNDGVSNE
jgi:hypothetical protein